MNKSLQQGSNYAESETIIILFDTSRYQLEYIAWQNKVTICKEYVCDKAELASVAD